MRSTVYSIIFCLMALGIVCGFLVDTNSWAGAENNKQYGYYYKDRFIVLNPSPKLIALEGNVPSINTVAATSGLVRDELSDEHAIKSKGMGIYRLNVQEAKSRQRIDLSTRIPSLLEKTEGMVQPVFEQGGTILIPWDEVIVAFKESTSLEQAQAFFGPYLASQGIEEIKAHRRNSFILRINDPSDGRIYAVAQYFALIDQIRFAEPNHIFLRQKAPKLNQFKPVKPEDAEFRATGTGVPQAIGSISSPENDLLSAPTWTTIASVDFESTTFPPAGWQTGIYSGKTQATWGRTSYRAHNGSYSMYCALGGAAGVSPPGPVPIEMGAFLYSPLYDLSSYEEVYIEAWFYAINDLFPGPGGSLYDLAIVFVNDNDMQTYTGRPLATYANGDCTVDPTTSNGWRRVLYRVPPSYLVSNAFFEFYYVSDDLDLYEGVYIDDIRIVGTTNVDTQPLGNDPYGGRQYELRNVGQVAGLGNDLNDLQIPEALNLVTVSSQVVVAVIDEGVELTHPDLNLVQGYDHNGDPGGGPKTSQESHGTACAGNVGAIINNGIGVAGTAPGVKIMPIHWGSTQANLASAIDVAVTNGADILSNSWGWVGAPNSTIASAIDDALADGRAVIFAAGNGPDRPPWTYDVAFPGNLTATKAIVTVGASSLTDEHKATASSDGEFGWGSSYVGSGPDVVAPGPWSYTTDRLGALGYNDGSTLSNADYTPDFGGTSSSTPKVAGIVALMLSANPDLTPSQIKLILRATADDIDASGVDDKTGAGRVNAYRAVLQTKGGVLAGVYLLLWGIP